MSADEVEPTAAQRFEAWVAKSYDPDTALKLTLAYLIGRYQSEDQALAAAVREVWEAHTAIATARVEQAVAALEADQRKSTTD